MKGMKDAREFVDAPPAGVWFAAEITAAEAGATGPKAKTPGVPQLKLTLEGREGDYDGVTMFDNLITDGTAKGAGMAKPRLRALCAMIGVDIESDVEVSDEEIAAKLTGMTVRVLGGHKPRQRQNGDKWEDIEEIVNGKRIKVMQLVPKEYASIDTAPAAGAQTAQGAAPAQQAQQAQPPFAQGNGAATPAPAAAQTGKPAPAWAKAAQANQAKGK